jgi:hypothetical protein
MVLNDQKGYQENINEKKARLLGNFSMINRANRFVDDLYANRYKNKFLLYPFIDKEYFLSMKLSIQ